MKSNGNGTSFQCVQNLLSIERGEVPMERLKGVDTRFFDMPKYEAKAGLIEDAKWLILTYEPRVNENGISIEAIEEIEGNFKLVASISENAIF